MKRMIKTSIGISVMLATALVHAGKATRDSEDVSGQGHTTTVLGDEDVKLAIVQF